MHTTAFYLFQDGNGISRTKLLWWQELYCNCLSGERPAYAFTAAMGEAPGYTRSYSHGDQVEFPVVLTNIGGAYNPTTGDFMCPISGTYMFAVSLMSGHQALGAASITVDDERKVSARPDGRDAAHGHSSNMLVTACTQGQRVWVQAFGWRLYDDSRNHGTFSGMLIYVN